MAAGVTQSIMAEVADDRCDGDDSLWTGDQLEYALDRQNIGELCEMKYRMCVDHGMLDFDVTTLE